ncbi:MAG: hypothetical protein HXY26_06235 [Hydrogenophilaceae bacterium]|nr:hypothetical protein [Hydrogenophilaceae bacterium]
MRLLLCLFMFLPLASQAADARIARDGMVMSIGMRNSEGVTAFYAARGFSKEMLEVIGQSCFVGVGIYNERRDTLWLELANWRFTDAAGREVKRITRPEWDARWDKMNAPFAARAAFDWTQLPESRDLQPGEPVGGNVAVVAPAGEFSLAARFRAGNGEVIEVTVPGLRCQEAKP